MLFSFSFLCVIYKMLYTGLKKCKTVKIWAAKLEAKNVKKIGGGETGSMYVQSWEIHANLAILATR